MRKKKKSKLRIGLFVHTLIDKYQKKIFNGINELAEQYNTDIIIFSGGFLQDQTYFNYQKNAIFDFAHHDNIDGIIAVSGSLSNKISFKELNKFFNQFDKVPIVSIGVEFENIPSIIIDNYMGIKNVTEHLIEKHGCKNIAFLRGPIGNCEADIRFTAFKDTLKKHNLSFKKNLIVSGDFLLESGKIAVRSLLKNKNLLCDALVSCNDYMAIDAMNELEKNGYNIPKDIAIVGFDNIGEGNFTIPGLTTVNQSPYMLGKSAFEKLYSIIKNEKYDSNQIIIPELIIRESCGCSYGFEINQRKVTSKTDSYLQDNILNIKKSLYKETKALISEFTSYKLKKSEINNISNNIVDCLINALSNNDPKIFIDLLNGILKLSKNIKIDIIHWNLCFMKILDLFFSNLFFENQLFILDLKLLIKDQIYKHSIYQYNEKKGVFDTLNWKMKEFINELMRVFTFDEMEQMVISEINNILIPSVFVSLFSNPECTLLKLAVSCRDGKYYKTKYKNTEFSKKDMISHLIKNDNKRKVYFASSIFCKESRFGAVLFEMNHDVIDIYEDLVLQLSAVVQQVYLFEEINRSTITLEEKVRERTLQLENAKNKIEKTNEELKMLDELKNDFIANITHDFRTPLTVILSISELVLKFNLDLDEELKSNFDVIHKASIKLKDSIDRLLELAKIDAKGIKLQIKKIKLKALMESISIFYVSSLVNTNIKIINKFPETEITNFYTDNEKFEQIINNLMSNAVKFVDKSSGEIILELIDKKNSVIIKIIDNGIGIEKNKLNIIFNRFEQIKMRKNSWQRGTGIGLAFSKQLVELLKGKIWAESEGLNKGASFYIELKKGKNVFDEEDIILDKLPTVLKKKNYMKELIISEIEQELENNNIIRIFKELNYKNEFDSYKGVILIIDDEKYIRDIIVKYLVNAGYKNFIITSNGFDGLNSIYDYKPDLIICDYSMENMKGDELHDEVLTNPRLKNIPFIFLSAVADEKVVLSRKNKGATAFLKKPINEEKFINTINNSMTNYMEYSKTKKMSYIDELTRLNNKSFLIKNLCRELSLRRHQDISVIIIDIDDFKYINNNYGYKIGDRIIEIVGDIIASSVREYDIPARFESDEFAVALPETNIIQAKKVAVELKRKIEKHKFNFDNNRIKITLSIGISSLLNGEDYICRSLNINNLKSIFDIENKKDANWDKIKEYKKQISHLLLKMADVSLHNAKCTICSDCGFLTENSNKIINNRCPKCKSENIIIGKNKIVVL